MMKSLHKREQLQGKLERVKHRMEKAERALARKARHASQRLNHTATAPESSAVVSPSVTARQQMEGGLPSWRKPHLENYMFKTPVVTSLLSNGWDPKNQFVTERMREARDQQIGNPDAAALKRYALISDGRNGVVKSDNSKFAEQLIIFERMTKDPRVRNQESE